MILIMRNIALCVFFVGLGQLCHDATDNHTKAAIAYFIMIFLLFLSPKRIR